MTLTADEAVLRRAVGSETLARGRQYATCGAVLTVQWAPTGDRVFGQVLGSAQRPYSAIAILESAADGALRSFAGACTCPVGTDCKHSVALALARPRSAARPSWEDRLVDLDDDRDRLESHASVGLQFDLQADPRAGDAVGTPRPTGLRVRPVLRSRSGTWVRTGISWSTLHLHGYGSYTHDPVDPRHLRLLNEIAALESSGGGGYGRYWATTSSAIDLADFPSRRLWDVLREAVDAGLPLLEAGKHARPVRLHRDPVELRLDLARDDASLTVSPSLAAAGEQWPAHGALLLGRPAHGVAVRGTADLHLAALLEEPDPLLSGLLSGDPLTIPAADEQRFLTTYLPQLRRRVPVTSTSGAVELPEIRRPELVVVVDPRQPRAVRLTWQWRYRVGARVQDVELWPGASGPGDPAVARDPRSEATTHAAVLEVLADIPGAFESPAPAAAAGRRLSAQALVTDMAASVSSPTASPGSNNSPMCASNISVTRSTTDPSTARPTSPSPTRPTATSATGSTCPSG